MLFQQYDRLKAYTDTANALFRPFTLSPQLYPPGKLIGTELDALSELQALIGDDYHEIQEGLRDELERNYITASREDLVKYGSQVVKHLKGEILHARRRALRAGFYDLSNLGEPPGSLVKIVQLAQEPLPFDSFPIVLKAMQMIEDEAYADFPHLAVWHCSNLELLQGEFEFSLTRLAPAEEEPEEEVKIGSLVTTVPALILYYQFTGRLQGMYEKYEQATVAKIIVADNGLKSVKYVEGLLGRREIGATPPKKTGNPATDRKRKEEWADNNPYSLNAIGATLSRLRELKLPCRDLEEIEDRIERYLKD